MPGTGKYPDKRAALDDTETHTTDLESIHLQVKGRNSRGEFELESIDARSLLDEGNYAMSEERHDDAIRHYERLLTVFPDSRLAPTALYNMGLALEGKGEYDAAIVKYGILARDKTRDRDSIDAHLRIASVQAELERWNESHQTLVEVLARSDLTHSDRIEGLARLGYATLERGDQAAAEAVLHQAVEYYKHLTTGLDTNYFVAMSYYYLAQIPHRQFRTLPMRPPEDQLKIDLDAKAELVARAYDRYLQSLQVQNAYWATAAGYQMSEIYKELWNDVVLAPLPAGLSAQARQLYMEEIHQRAREFLERAMNGHSRNIQLAEAYKTTTAWSNASRRRTIELAAILARESSGELVTPERKKIPVPQYIPARIDL